MRTLTDIIDIEDRIDLEEVFHHVDKTTQMLSTPVNATLNHTGEVHMRHEVPLRIVTVSPSDESHPCMCMRGAYSPCTEIKLKATCLISVTRDATTWVFMQERNLLCVLL